MDSTIKKSAALLVGVASMTAVGCGSADTSGTPTSGAEGTTNSNNQTYQQYVIERRTQISQMAEYLESHPDALTAFQANPNELAASYGVRFTPEELVGIQSAHGLTAVVPFLCGVMMEDAAAFYDNNCGCGGGGTCGW